MSGWLTRMALEPELELNGVAVPIVLRRHHSARRLTLRLAPDGSAVKLTLPHWAQAREAIAFAHARTEWLAAQHQKIPQRAAPEPGGTITYRGKPKQIEWAENARRRPALDGDVIRLGGPQEGLEQRLKRWLEKDALTLFEADMHDYTQAADLDPVPVGLSRAQKRWGSCSDKSRIRINWRLVQAPDFVRRSVVAHEVAHLVHFDHSPAFHALLGDIYESEISDADRWLKDHGRTLYASFG
ncbi:MAG: SprT family zinc-dependent metalloprotease [Pseudomonadota bacterium]